MIRKILVTVFLIMVVSVVAESDWRYWLGRDEVGSSYMNVSSEIETLPDNFDKTVIEQSADIALLGEVDGDNPGLELVTWDGEQVKTFDMNLKLLNTFTPAGMYRINLLEDIDNDGENEIGMGCRETGYVRFYDKKGKIEWEYHEDIGYDGEFDIGKVEEGKVYIMNSAGYSGKYRGISRVDMETSTQDWRFRTGSEVHKVSFYNDLIAFGTNTPHTGWSFNGFDDSHIYHMIVDEEGNLVLGEQVDNTHKNGGVRNYFLYDGYLLGLENHSGHYPGNETLHIIDKKGNTILKKEMRYKNDFEAGLHAAYNEDIIVACDGERLYTFDAKEKKQIFTGDLEEDDLRLYALVETSGSYIVLLGDNNDEKIRIIELNKEGTEIIEDETVDVKTGEIRGIIPTVEDSNLILFITGQNGVTKLEPTKQKIEKVLFEHFGKTFGGSKEDSAINIQPTSDGGYIVVGYSFSNDGDVENHHGSTAYHDYWLLKLNNDLNIEWQRSLGGTFYEDGRKVIQTKDGGYVVVGRCLSDDRDVNDHYGSIMFPNYWTVKLNENGDIEWTKSLGGSMGDHGNCIQQTSDGGYIVAGWGESNSGDVSENKGNNDYWIVKLNSSGNIEWEKSLGGSNDDEAWSIQQTSKGTYVIAGRSKSNDGDVPGNKGDFDCWIVKLDRIAKALTTKKISRNLIAYWGMNEGVTSYGTLVDESGNNLNGDVYNKYKMVDGVLGKALYLYGEGWCTNSGGHVILPYIDFESMDEFTISLWVKEDELSHYHGEGYIFTGKSRACLTIGHYTGDLRFTVGVGKEKRVLSLDFKDEYKSNFVHYCLVYKNGISKAYVNANEVGEIVNKLEIGEYDNEKKFGLGIHWWDHYGFNEVSTRFIGAIDEVRIYNRALKEDEISQLFNLEY